MLCWRLFIANTVLANSNRPLSPHLQVYRPQLTSVLSILHRAAGVVLTLGAWLIALWLCALAAGGEWHRLAYEFLNALPGQGLMFIWTLCACYHLCNGIRHLIWDAGYALELSAAYLSGKIAVAAAIALTIWIWVF